METGAAKKFNPEQSIVQLTIHETARGDYNDCLFNIFSLLPIVDRIRVQRVCKRWQAVARMPWRNIKALDCSNSWTDEGQPRVLITLRILAQVLRLCGQYVVTFSVATSNDEQPQQIEFKANVQLFELLKQFCPNLQNIDLFKIPISPEGYEYMASHLRDIVRLRIRNEDDDCEEAVASFLKSAKKLKSLRFDNRFCDNWLNYLPFDTLEELSLALWSPLLLKNATDAIEKCYKLRVLRLFVFSLFIEIDFSDLLSVIGRKDLVELELHIAGLPRTIPLDRLFTGFCHLHTLDLSMGASIDDSILKSIAERAKLLKSISFGGSKGITDSGLSLFPDVEEISLYTLSNVCGSFFGSMANLNRVIIGNCENIRDRYMLSLLDTAKKLRYLKLYGFRSIDYLIQHALVVREKNKCGAFLTICAKTEETFRSFKNDYMRVEHFE